MTRIPAFSRSPTSSRIAAAGFVLPQAVPAPLEKKPELSPLLGRGERADGGGGKQGQIQESLLLTLAHAEGAVPLEVLRSNGRKALLDRRPVDPGGLATAFR